MARLTLNAPQSGGLSRTSTVYIRKYPQRVVWGGSVTAGTSPGVIWTLMPSGQSSFLHTTSNTYTNDTVQMIDYTDSQFCRMFCCVQSAAAQSTTALEVQYSLDLSSWSSLISLTLGNSTGAKDSDWQSMPQGARQLVYLRLTGLNGNGIASPRFSFPTLMSK